MIQQAIHDVTERKNLDFETAKLVMGEMCIRDSYNMDQIIKCMHIPDLHVFFSMIYHNRIRRKRKVPQSRFF